MKTIVLASTLLYASAANAFFLEMFGWSMVSEAATKLIAQDQSDYRDANYESPIEEIEISSKDAQHCDPFGGCTNYVSSTTIRKVREYRYDWKPEWNEWAFREYK